MGTALIKLAPAVDAQTIANTIQKSDGDSFVTEAAARVAAKATATNVVPASSFRIVKGDNAGSLSAPTTNSHRHENTKRTIHSGI